MWFGNEGYFAIKEGLAEYYRREFSAGRFPQIMPEKGKLMELYAADIITKDEINRYTPVSAQETKSGLIAVISVTGIMTKFGQACAYGTDQIISQIDAAISDPRITAIVMKWHTPGGEVAGTKALGLAIRQSPKVVVSYVSQADSAGYWGASQSKEIILEDSADAEVGSIGVYGIVWDETKALEQQGVSVYIVRAEGSEDKALGMSMEPINESILIDRKKSVTAIRAEFVNEVKTTRPNIPEEAFTGKTYRGKDAVKLNLVDRIGSLQDAILRADFLSRKQARQTQLNQSNNNNKAEEMGFFNELFAKHKPTDAAAAEALADQEIAQKDEKINALTGEVSAKDVKINELQAKVQELEPKASKYEEIKEDYEANAQYVKNLKDAGIMPPVSGTDANADGEKKLKSYEKAPWNALAMKMRENQQ
ncbi:S49 family peptidase [Flectobacillus roseus]|uniref:S49 family peptidase n=1 Tax=Flectobacillus roseus TaxID=502259 RepID=UPI0024B6383C|nr:S49 family peptidase [Flectobacillus roseus]MDI9872119.1 S49 family peptidase [Flectobacillus roseus]